MSEMFIPKLTKNRIKYYGTEHPKITICGPDKYWKRSLEAANKLVKEGWIVFLPVFSLEAVGCNESVMTERDWKDTQSWLHVEKIAQSHAIYVVNVNNNIGESTNYEIAQARKRGKIVYYMDSTNLLDNFYSQVVETYLVSSPEQNDRTKAFRDEYPE